MTKSVLYVPLTHSTNNLMREKLRESTPEEGFLLYTDFQTAGKGQPGNSWESEKGKNLLFSIQLYPHQIPIQEQFFLSELTCLAIKQSLDKYADGFSIKWPNDIYWKDRKIGGILIENSLSKGRIENCIIGIGLNINQELFRSNAPNPVSLKQILGKTVHRKVILQTIHNKIKEYYESFNLQTIHQNYLKNLYRKDDYYLYKDVSSNTLFSAKIDTVEGDGKLVLLTDKGEFKEYYFKEVQFIH